MSGCYDTYTGTEASVWCGISPGHLHVSVQHNCVDIVTCWMATLSTGGQEASLWSGRPGPGHNPAQRCYSATHHQSQLRHTGLCAHTWIACRLQRMLLLYFIHCSHYMTKAKSIDTYFDAHWSLCNVAFLSNFSPLLSNNSLQLLFIINIHSIVCHWPLWWSMTLALFQLQDNTPHSLTQIQMQTIRNIGILGSILYITCLLFTALT